MNMKLLKRMLILLLSLFLVIFAARTIYDFVTYEENGRANSTPYFGGYTNETEEGDLSYSVSEQRLAKNIATEKFEAISEETGALQPGAATDQKYEKVADIATKSADFDADRKRLSEIIDEQKGMVQTENSRGLAGDRRVDMTIGVRPEAFDTMRTEIAGIGTLVSCTITKTDKTYEYSQMLADKAILERRKASFEELKTLSGSIPERMQLQEKIIDVEAQIQNQLIGLGEYSDNNSFCTINVSLFESESIDVASILWHSLIWSLRAYLGLLAILFFVSLTAVLAMLTMGLIQKRTAKHAAEETKKE